MANKSQRPSASCADEPHKQGKKGPSSKNSSAAGQVLQTISALSCTYNNHNRQMARKAKVGSLPDASLAPVGYVHKYGQRESDERLVKEGFHPKASNLTPNEHIKSWLKMSQRLAKKPTKAQFKRGATKFQGQRKSTSRQLTRGLLTYRSDFIQDGFHGGDVRTPQANNVLVKLLESADIGGLITEYIFADGRDTVQNVSLTCTHIWRALAINSNIYDFLASEFRTKGHNGVFTVITPEYTIGEFKAMVGDESHNPETGDSQETRTSDCLSNWYHLVMQHEQNVTSTLHLMHGRLGCLGKYYTEENGYRKTATTLIDDGFFDQEVIRVVKALEDIDEVQPSSQFDLKSDIELFQSPAVYSIRRLEILLKQIYQQRASIRVLYIENTPCIDRRVLAVILRACPNLTTLGVYDCPLISFGDVICLLDLIWEINQERRNAPMPLISDFDFRPHYEAGMPYFGNHAATYGLTWGPRRRQILQRGFYFIILKAFMKASSLRLLDSLFSKDKAFVGYLLQIPNLPLSVPGFLDALWRFQELNPKDDENRRKKIIYDLLKPVRMGLEDMDRDWPRWYVQRMGTDPMFCASCGYETFQDFYNQESRLRLPHQRYCAGCIIMTWYDQEEDHCKKKKKDVISVLCPGWNGKAFNHDAPISSKGQGILRLVSTETVRPEPPQLRVNAQGEWSSPRCREPFVRDAKLHGDSLQKLPSLQELVEDPASDQAWMEAKRKCFNLEIYCRCIRVLYRLYGRNHPITSSIKHSSDDTDEGQPKAKACFESLLSLDFEAAMKLHEKPAGDFW
ncbi:hypothetical protein S40293_03842 [Stachybotrys chartarum IBT 40293]|nr:hypothetical protein S40293_03842 [Stachybotrys chartarum IBT 40293]